jgi:hypothetical protein
VRRVADVVRGDSRAGRRAGTAAARAGLGLSVTTSRLGIASTASGAHPVRLGAADRCAADRVVPTADAVGTG